MKTGETGLEVLKAKHPDIRPDTEAIFRCYIGMPPVLVPLDIMTDTVMEVVHLLLGGPWIWERT